MTFVTFQLIFINKNVMWSAALNVSVQAEGDVTLHIHVNNDLRKVLV